MDPFTIDFATWLAAGDDERTALAQDVARRVGGELFAVRHGTGDVAFPSIRVRGFEMVFVPGGTSTLGWAGGPSGLTEEQAADYEEAMEVSFDERLRAALGEARTVTLPPFLIEAAPKRVDTWVDPEDVDAEEQIVEVVERDGFRIVSDDEWEHAVRAGRTTMFRWGEGWPPEEGDFTAFRERTDLGLTVTADPYITELTAGFQTLRGGDGGHAVCGGEVWPGDWISFALAFRALHEEWEEVVPETLASSLVRRMLSIG